MIEKKIDILKTTNEYIDKVIIEIKNITELIQSGNEIAGISRLVQVLDGIDYICKVISLTEEVHKEKISIEEINEKLKEIIDSFENEDYILLGDLINYELLPILESIQNVMILSVESFEKK